MPAIGTLWTPTEMRRGKVILASASLGGLEFDVPTDYKHHEDNKKQEFLSKFPHGKISALEMKDGFKLFEGAAVARYVSTLAPTSGLLGAREQEAALVDQWVCLAESVIRVNGEVIYLLVNGMITPYSKPIHTAFVARQLDALKPFESHLATRTLLVNERITLADITLASILQVAVAVTIDASVRAQFPNTIRHFETVVNQPKLKDIFGPTTYVETALQYTPPPKEKKEAAPQPTAASASSKEKKFAKQEDDEEDELLVPAEPKAKNPLDSLPKSKFNLEDWKRAYSNKETRGPGGALEWFYENFDKEGFSVWRVDFKYNDELTQIFMSSNQIGSFFNRLEESRKYLFGSVGVLGEVNNSIILGVLIVRGQEVKGVVDVAPDWES